MDRHDNNFSLDKILSPIASDLVKVEKIAIENLDKRIPLLREIGCYTFKAGGKRIRPALLLFSAGMHGDINDDIRLAATVIEYIHAASLLHDDVVDDANLRRGRDTVRKAWGNEAAVLSGDYLFMLSFKLLNKFKKQEILDSVLTTATAMTEGELIQLDNKVKFIDENDILSVIEKKTSSLIGAAMEMGTILTSDDVEAQKVMRKCGEHIGTAFQLIDDALDYEIKNESFGKMIGKDFSEKKVTIPLHHLLRTANLNDKELVENLFRGESINSGDLKEIYSLMTKYNSIAYTIQKAETYCEMTIDLLKVFPDSPYKQGIADLTKFITSRTV